MLVRAVFYLLDALRLRRVVSQLRTGDHDFVIFDRYLYDRLAQIHSDAGWRRLHSIAGGFGAEAGVCVYPGRLPADAFTRKPEYPLDFMYSYRSAFLGLSVFVPQLVVIGPATVENVRQVICGACRKDRMCS